MPIDEALRKKYALQLVNIWKGLVWEGVVDWNRVPVFLFLSTPLRSKGDTGEACSWIVPFNLQTFFWRGLCLICLSRAILHRAPVGRQGTNPSDSCHMLPILSVCLPHPERFRACLEFSAQNRRSFPNWKMTLGLHSLLISLFHYVRSRTAERVADSSLIKPGSRYS